MLRAEAAVFLAAVLEYMCAELLELAGNAAEDLEQQRCSAEDQSIGPRHIMLAVRNDEELDGLYQGTIAGGGVLPHIHKQLLRPDFIRKDNTAESTALLQRITTVMRNGRRHRRLLQIRDAQSVTQRSVGLALPQPLMGRTTTDARALKAVHITVEASLVEGMGFQDGLPVVHTNPWCTQGRTMNLGMHCSGPCQRAPRTRCRRRSRRRQAGSY